jgi:predicted transcriptional regulator
MHVQVRLDQEVKDKLDQLRDNRLKFAVKHTNNAVISKAISILYDIEIIDNQLQLDEEELEQMSDAEFISELQGRGR